MVVDGVVVMDSSHPPAAFEPLTAVFVASGTRYWLLRQCQSPLPFPVGKPIPVQRKADVMWV